jgi:hypothetical protein
LGSLPPFLWINALAGQAVLAPLGAHCCACARFSGLGSALAHGHRCAGVCALAPGCGEASANLRFLRAGLFQGLSELLMVFGRTVAGGRRALGFEALVLETA